MVKEVRHIFFHVTNLRLKKTHNNRLFQLKQQTAFPFITYIQKHKKQKNAQNQNRWKVCSVYPAPHKADPSKRQIRLSID